LSTGRDFFLSPRRSKPRFYSTLFVTSSNVR
jgi:hypothetical protein